MLEALEPMEGMSMKLNVDQPRANWRERAVEAVVSADLFGLTGIRNIGTYEEAVVAFNKLETRNWDLFAALGWALEPDPIETLRNTLRKLIGREHIFFTPSGQCAIAQVLSLLPQREVVMPAFMCYQVKQAIEGIGKRIIYVDQAKNSVNATAAEYAEAAQPGRILLVVHMYGIPTDIMAICELARERGCVTIEDAVPGFGGNLNGHALGTFADFGVFSFQQSKRIPAFRGGFIVVNNERIVDPESINTRRVIETKRGLPIGGMVQALIHNFATAPWFYRNLTLPLLGLRETLPRFVSRLRQKTIARLDHQSVRTLRLPQTPDYTREIHPYQAELINRMMDRWDGIRQRIARQVAIYAEVFQGTPIQTFLSPECDAGALMRFPIAFPGKDRAAIVSRALRHRLYLKLVWPRPLPEVSEYYRCPNAVWASRNLVLLPLYSRLSLSAAELMARGTVEIDREMPSA